VPQVQGLAQRAAWAALRRAGFNVKVHRQYSDSVASGKVISSSPAAGESLQRGRTVTLIVSRGRQPVAMPKVTGLSKGDAEQQLKSAGLQVNERERESAGTPGAVLAQDPAPGTALHHGDTVTLTIAKARPQVPDVSSDHPSLDDATKTLSDAGFRARTRQQPSDQYDGLVIRQYPPPGTPRSTGATVTLVVGTPSASPTPTPTPSASPTPTPTPTPTP
jgi:serine/threonine-protein kinase